MEVADPLPEVPTASFPVETELPGPLALTELVELASPATFADPYVRACDEIPSPTKAGRLASPSPLDSPVDVASEFDGVAEPPSMAWVPRNGIGLWEAATASVEMLGACCSIPAIAVAPSACGMWGAAPSVVAELADDEEFLSGARASIRLGDSIAAVEPFVNAVDKFRLGRFGAIAETDALTVVVTVTIADEPEVFSLLFAFLAVDACFRPVSEAEVAVGAAVVLPCCNTIPFDRSPAAATRIGDCTCPFTGEAATPFGSAEGNIDTDDSTVSSSRPSAGIEALLLASGVNELDADTSARLGCDPALVAE